MGNRSPSRTLYFFGNAAEIIAGRASADAASCGRYVRMERATKEVLNLL
jgi:hypothetical protein